MRLRRVAELAPDATIDSNPAWRANLDATQDIPEVRPDDVPWADAVLFGTPTRRGNVSAQLKGFIYTLGCYWRQGLLSAGRSAGSPGTVVRGRLRLARTAPWPAPAATAPPDAAVARDGEAGTKTRAPCSPSHTQRTAAM